MFVGYTMFFQKIRMLILLNVLGFTVILERTMNLIALRLN